MFTNYTNLLYHRNGILVMMDTWKNKMLL